MTVERTPIVVIVACAHEANHKTGFLLLIPKHLTRVSNIFNICERRVIGSSNGGGLPTSPTGDSLCVPETQQNVGRYCS